MESCPRGRRCSTRNAVYVKYLGFESLTLRQCGFDRTTSRKAVMFCGFFKILHLGEFKMFSACTYEEIEEIERRVNYKEIVILLFVRPNIDGAINIIKEFEYIHYNSGKYCSVYAVGYTNNFEKSKDESFKKVNIDLDTEWYFSIKEFTEFKNKLENRINWNYSGETEILILQNNPTSSNALNFQNYVAIDVNKGIREGYIDSFQRFMESLIRTAKTQITAKEAIRNMSLKRISIKDIISESINDCKKIPTPVKRIIKDNLFYRCATNIKKYS